jgi:tetrahydromethanopterin S-methyltransferase subunit H
VADETPIGDAIAKLGSEQGIDVAVAQAQDREAQIRATAAVKVGKGWSVGGAAQWARDGWAWAVGASWRPKSK